jgi:hypothetical protein
MDNAFLFKKLADLPDELKSQVIDYIDSLMKKSKKPRRKNRAKFGSGKGMFVIKPGFDEPLSDFKEYIP